MRQKHTHIGFKGGLYDFKLGVLNGQTTTLRSTKKRIPTIWSDTVHTVRQNNKIKALCDYGYNSKINNNNTIYNF